MNKALADLIRISNAAGKNPSFVQGGGGNTSIKTDDGKFMYIKASGTALKDMNPKKGWRRIKLAPVISLMQDESLAKLPVHTREPEVVNRLLLACDDNVTDGSRPSVEAHLHAYLGKCVIHLHPSAVGAYVNAKGGKAKLERLFKDLKKPFLWVPYADPGYMLAKKITELTAKYEENFQVKPQVIFLEKHGLFISASSPNSSLQLTKKVTKKCSDRLKHPTSVKARPVQNIRIQQAAMRIRKAFYDACGDYGSVSYFTNDTIASFLRRKDCKRLLRGVLTPDELFYSNGPALWLENLDAKKITAKIRAFIDKGQKPPIAFLVKGLGLFAAGKKMKAITVRDIVTSSLFIRTNADRLGSIAALNKRQQDFINKWRSETFRKTFAAGVGVDDLQGRIAVVTGAGSGLGKSIAIGLARAGVMVALADIDEKAALQAQQDIQNQIAGSHTVAIKCNVTDQASVEAGFTKIIDQFGGLDILVNAAGVAPAGALVDLPVDKWRFANEVNLTGYFLMAKYAARVMI
ncbi:MAG: SDR family NAD(P)-dependent oxidoreductase, partial [Planctomycetes bacterium]|nr:SDR family NAD(P)-dependent oxidoreductase [Planctomycetota bacterium]